MEKITAFGYDIYKANLFDDDKNIPEHLITLALYELSRKEVQATQSCNLDKGGPGICLSTFETPANSFFSFPESSKLLDWIKIKVLEVSSMLGFKNCSSADLTVDWMNVMYKHSFGNCHTHDDDNEPDTARKVVAVFYLKAPENSAKLLAIKNTRDYSARGIDPNTIPQDEIVEIEVKSGDLVIHKVDMPHAVSTHLSDDTRLCLVMEFRYDEE